MQVLKLGKRFAHRPVTMLKGLSGRKTCKKISAYFSFFWLFFCEYPEISRPPAPGYNPISQFYPWNHGCPKIRISLWSLDSLLLPAYLLAWYVTSVSYGFTFSSIFLTITKITLSPLRTNRKCTAIFRTTEREYYLNSEGFSRSAWNSSDLFATDLFVFRLAEKAESNSARTG